MVYGVSYGDVCRGVGSPCIDADPFPQLVACMHCVANTNDEDVFCCSI